jgi:hypothetical protein
MHINAPHMIVFGINKVGTSVTTGCVESMKWKTPQMITPIHIAPIIWIHVYSIVDVLELVPETAKNT